MGMLYVNHFRFSKFSSIFLEMDLFFNIQLFLYMCVFLTTFGGFYLYLSPLTELTEISFTFSKKKYCFSKPK